jgi:hypothetical protein
MGMNQKTMISTMLMAALTFAIVGIGIGTTANATAQTQPGTYVKVHSITKWQGNILDSTLSMATQAGSGDKIFPMDCSQGLGIFSATFQNMADHGFLQVSAFKDGIKLKETTTNAPYGVVMISGECN